MAAAGERGQSHYLPGYYGDFAVAIVPEMGTYTYTTVYSYNGTSQGPKLASGAQLDAVASISGFLHATPIEIFGGRYAFGAYGAYASGSLAVHLNTPAGLAKVGDDTNGFSDLSISPISLYWSAGNFHWNLYSAVFVPTGSFSESKLLNIGRNYWSWDNVLALTWLDRNIGLEVSLVPGLMYNNSNAETDYRTGTEFHLDYMINQFVTPEFAVGLQGYVYDQLVSDRDKSDRTLSGFGAAIGPAVMWRPTSIGINGKVVGKWLHEYEAENRFKGDILSITATVRF